MTQEQTGSRERSLDAAARLADRAAPFAVGVGVFVVTSVVYGVGSNDPALDAGIVVLAAAAAVAGGVARRWRTPLLVVTVLGVLLCSSWPGLVVASYYAATTWRRNLHVASFALGATAALVGMPLVYAAFGADYVIGSHIRFLTLERLFLALFLVGLPLAVGLWIGARRQVLAALRERTERLEREHAARAEQARAAERARIAREMHDVVAHKVSLIVLHAGALEVDAPDDETESTANLIRTTGREALTGLRDVVGVLRSPDGGTAPLAPPPSLGDVEDLVEQSRSAGIPVELRVEGTARSLPEAAERTAYRVVQEALTNVHKHADQSTVEVTIRYLPNRLDVAVHNSASSGGHEDGWLPGSGVGLIGLRERLSLVGGSLEAGPEGSGGFAVRASVPAASAQDTA